MTTPEQNRIRHALIAALRLLIPVDPATGRVELELTSAQLDEAHNWELCLLNDFNGIVVQVDNKMIPTRSVDALIREARSLAWDEGLHVGLAHARGLGLHGGVGATNPYRKEGDQ